jgi:hypothetical protein
MVTGHVASASRIFAEEKESSGMVLMRRRVTLANNPNANHRSTQGH